MACSLRMRSEASALLVQVTTTNTDINVYLGAVNYAITLLPAGPVRTLLQTALSALIPPITLDPSGGITAATLAAATPALTVRWHPPSEGHGCSSGGLHHRHNPCRKLHQRGDRRGRCATPLNTAVHGRGQQRGAAEQSTLCDCAVVCSF